MLPLLLLSTVLLLAPSARANWLESGAVQISRATEIGSEPVEASEIGPDDVVISVHVGPSGVETGDGEVTVVSEGGGLERAALGTWNVAFGTGNVQSTYGAADVFNVGSGTSEAATAGELDILNSDVTGPINVKKGALRVHTGSQVGSINVSSPANAYIVEGSRAQVISTSAGSFLNIDASIIAQVGVQLCDLRGTALIVDSSVHCGALDMSSGADTDLYPFLGSLSELRIQNKLRMVGADLDAQSSIVSTGGLELSGNTEFDTSLHVSTTDWTNAGDLTFLRPMDGPLTLRISGGSEFLEQGTVHVYNASGAGLFVTGGGTELEVDEDLFVGQFFLATPQPVPATMTVADGAVVIVHGTFVLGTQGVLNLEPGGTIYADATEINGTINENGGELVVPEPASALAGASALLALAWRSRRHS